MHLYTRLFYHEAFETNKWMANYSKCEIGVNKVNNFKKFKIVYKNSILKKRNMLFSISLSYK